MKVLKIILLILLVIVGGLAIWMATLPGKYDVKRTMFIEATPELVFAEVSDFKTWPNWGPWFAKDSTMVVEFGEISQGLGATYSWTSEAQGNGSMEIIEAVAGKSLNMQLNFDGMGSTTSYWTFEAKDGGTEVTWGFIGEMPFFMRWASLGMEKAIGPDFETGLNNLKEILQSRKPVTAIAEVMLESFKIYYTHHNIGWDEITSELYGNSYSKIAAYLAEDMAKMSWKPMSIIHVWDEVEQTTEIDIAMPCTSSKPASGDILVGQTYAGKALKAIHMGNYSETGPVHFALEDYMIANQLEANGPVMEVYITDATQEPDTSKWVTEIYYPIK